MTEQLAKAHDLVPLVIPAPAGTSTQPGALDEEVIPTPNEGVQPPLPLEQLARLTTTQAYRRPIIEAIALNTVGQGLSIEVAEGREEDVGGDPEQLRSEWEATLAAWWARDTRLNNPTPTRGFSRVKWDEEEVGNGYIEISRNRVTGQINGLFHLPGAKMRKLKDGTGWVLLPKSGWAGGSITGRKDVVRFYNYGEKVQYDDDGRPQPKLQGNGKVWARNEVLAFQLPTSESRDYGLPRDHQLTIDYLGDKLAAESNVSFFQSSGTPPTVIFVQGEEVKDGSRTSFRVPRETAERIAATLKSDAGHLNRVAIIPVPPGTKTNEVKLGEVSDRDVGFTGYRGDNLKRQLGAFRLQPIFVARTEDAEGLSVETQRSITLEQLFDPEQTEWEGRLNGSIIRELTGGNGRIKFKRLAVENDAIRRESANSLAERGNITRREDRESHGLGALPEAAHSDTEIEWQGGTYKSAEPEAGQVPHGWNDELVPASGLPRGAENRNGLTDDRGGGPNDAGDDFTSNRPDQLPSKTEAAVAKGHGSADVEPVVEALTHDLTNLSGEALQAALRRSLAVGVGVAAVQGTNGNGAAPAGA